MTDPGLESLLLPVDATVRDAMACIDRNNRIGIALVVDDQRRLLGTITDGDLRRAVLAAVDLATPVSELLVRQRELHEPRPMPLTAPLGTDAAELVVLMRRYDVRQIPIVDGEGRVHELSCLEDLIAVEGPPLRAVVMAGGFGTRLGELTRQMPKPMLPVGDRPLLERIVEQLREAGIRHINFTTHYRSDQIASHFGDGREFGVEIQYVSEDRPLGTAGSLALLDSDGPLLVMNGDILTSVDFRAMHRFHDEHEADMTVAVRQYQAHLPYGLVELDGDRVNGIREKPLVQGFVNAGIYLINPGVTASVPQGEPLEMPELISRLVDGGRRVVGFPLREYWLDIGRRGDYERALEDAERL